MTEYEKSKSTEKRKPHHTNDKTETRFSKEGIGGSRISDFIEPFCNPKKCSSKNLMWKIWKTAIFGLEHKKKPVFEQFSRLCNKEYGILV